MIWLRALAVFAIAAALRLPDLDVRPMHADEAVQAARLDNPAYSPADYHGPVLAYLTRAAGVRSFAAATEASLRLVPALAGCLLAALLVFWDARSPNVKTGLVAGLFTACSPALTYYSRDYIPEILLVAFTTAMLWSGWRYLARPAPAWALTSGLFAGLAFATKETAVLAIAAACLVALQKHSATHWKHWGLFGIGFVLYPLIFLGPAGFVSALQGIAGIWIPRAVSGSVHTHGPLFYLDLLVRTEWPLLVLAGLGSFGNPRLAAWTALVLLGYSALPYKTPWCAMTPLIGFVLLAASGAASLRFGPAIAFAACMLLVTRDPSAVWSYAETSPDVRFVEARLASLDRSTPIQVISTRNVWPLPWYLRRFSHIRWWNGVPSKKPLAPVILATPEMEEQLVRAMYELPPPGRRTLYTHLFPGPLYLRTGVELRGYAAATLQLE